MFAFQECDLLCRSCLLVVSFEALNGKVCFREAPAKLGGMSFGHRSSIKAVQVSVRTFIGQESKFVFFHFFWKSCFISVACLYVFNYFLSIMTCNCMSANSSDGSHSIAFFLGFCLNFKRPLDKFADQVLRK